MKLRWGLVALFALCMLGGAAKAQNVVNPLGCPYLPNSTACGVPTYPNGSPYAINALAMGSDGNVYRSVVSSNVADPTSATECGVNWQPVWIFNGMTIAGGTAINVPSKCGTVGAAITWLSNAVIASQARAQIHPADGTYSFGTTSISLDNPFGRQIDLIGNTATPANVVFNFSGVTTTAAVVRGLFELHNGNAFGTINGITYNGPSNSVCTPNCQTASSGYPGSILLYATGSGAFATVGPNVTMSNGYSGVAAFFGAYIVADGTDCSGSADGCFWSYGGGIVSFIGAKAHNSATPVIFAGSGALCDNAAYCIADGSFLYSNNFGMALFNNSGVRTNGPGGQATFGKDASGTSLRNAAAAFQFSDTSIFNVEGTPIFGPAESTCKTNITNWPQGGNLTDTGCNIQATFVSNGNYANIVLVNNGTTLQMEMNKSGQPLFGDTTVKTALASQGNFPLWLVANNLVNQKLNTDGSTTFSAGPPKTGGTTFTSSGCSATSLMGTGAAGKFTSGTTGTCTVTITMNGATGMTAPNGWACTAQDRTTPGDIINQTGDSATTATFSGTTATGDVISFSCAAY